MLTLCALCVRITHTVLPSLPPFLYTQRPNLPLHTHPHLHTVQEVLFSTVGGLRGGLALILVQTVVAAHTATPDPRLKVTG